jgi:hypothetical protein
MDKVKHFQITILTFLLLFFIGATLLRIVNLISLAPAELYGYGFILYGIATVYTTFGEENRTVLFLGSVVFLVGITISLPIHFDIIGISHLYIPAALLIGGISLLIVYIDDFKNTVIFAGAIILILAGILLIIISEKIYGTVFLKSIFDFIVEYWPVLLIAAGITYILKR